MSDELDDELQGLLDELDDREEDIIENTLSSTEPESEPEGKVEKEVEDAVIEEEEPDPLDDLEDIADEGDGTAMRPVDVRRMGPDEINDLSEPQIDEESESPGLPIEMEKYRDQLETVTQEVLDACRSDRQEAQDVINDLRQRLQASSGGKGPPPKALVDGIVKAVEVKAGINQNAIKMMDTNARFLASIKTTFNQTNNLSVGSSDELKRILDGSMDDD